MHAVWQVALFAALVLVWLSLVQLKQWRRARSSRQRHRSRKEF